MLVYLSQCQNSTERNGICFSKLTQYLTSKNKKLKKAYEKQIKIIISSNSYLQLARKLFSNCYLKLCT